MRILIYPYTGFFVIETLKIFLISFAKNLTEDKFIGSEAKTSWKFPVIRQKERLLEEETVEKFSFFLEVCYEIFLIYNRGISGIFLLFKKIFIKDLEFFCVLFNLFAIRLWYLCLEDSLELFKFTWRNFKCFSSRLERMLRKALLRKVNITFRIMLTPERYKPCKAQQQQNLETPLKYLKYFMRAIPC